MYEETLVTTFESLFKIDSTLIGLLIILASVCVVGILTYLYTGSYLISSFMQIPILIFGLYLGWIPIWILLIYLTFCAGMLILAPASEPMPEREDTDAWSSYGQRLKNAYSAKFGGENAGFNDEVDKRIEIMRHLKRGFSHTIARDWLRRMKGFTEAK